MQERKRCIGIWTSFKNWDYIDSESHIYEGEKLSQAEEGVLEMSMKRK